MWCSYILLACKNCSSVPSLGQLPSLKKLHIAKMESLAKIGAEFYGNGSSTSIRPFKSLEILHFKDMPKWEQWLPSAVEDGEFPSIQELHIQNCGKLAKNLPRYLPSLTLLHIEECKILDFLDDSRRYTELQTLHIIGCDSLESFPLGFFNKVAYLQIQKCSQLKYIEVSNDLPPGPGAPISWRLGISKCRSLELLPVLTSLETLALSDCRNLKSFRNDRLPPNLRSLFIMSCDHLTPKKNWGLNEMDSLTSLTITGGCSDVKSFPEKGLLPASLISLQVTKFPKLETLDLRGLQLLTSLRTLGINSCASLQRLVRRDLTQLSC
ncbi:hypothetical protein Patl1_17040 [Pistacia atlantica]|uniref:Uncharacterized protein n=1 Tax=Pistacia atlantica TaxID=434234 RepID=A0ACC1B8F6_9ROSI|nr:hypothetical protein Patl1_17040 [Pistacia atlantica]